MSLEPLFDLTAFARRVRVRMADLNLSYRDAAPLIGVAVPTLNRVARAKGPPDVENYLRIERWLQANSPSNSAEPTRD